MANSHAVVPQRPHPRSVIRVRLTDRDLVSMRLTYAPYWDILCAATAGAMAGARAGHGSGRSAGASAGVRRRRRLLEAAGALSDLPALASLADGVVPAFLSIVPDPGERLEASLDRILATDAGEIQRSLRHVAARLPARRDTIVKAWADPAEALLAVASAFRMAWANGFAEAWPSLESVHLGDIAQRSLVLANDGPFRLFDDLRPGAWLDGYELVLPRRCEWTSAPSGAGITLIASLFASDDYLAGSLPGGRWLLVYPPAGRSLAWLDDGPTADAQMTELIGPVRAQILAALQVPRTTGEIARLCGLAPNTASYHLARLREAGMVMASRSGRRSFYRLARRGGAFLALWDAASVVDRDSPARSAPAA